MQNDNTSPLPEATEQLDIALLDRDQLSKLDAKQHYDLAEVLSTTRDVLVGFNCQPRFNRERAESNSAGDIIENIVAGFDSAIELVRESALSTASPNAQALTYKWMVQIAREVSYAEDLHQIAKLSIEAAKEIAVAKLREERRVA